MDLSPYLPVFINILMILAGLFIFVIGLAVLALIVLYILDVTQTKQAIRRNFPVIGRLRYFFEHLGTFFRQYFFAMDREELPFNREQRGWVYRACKNLSNTVPFGSTRNLRAEGAVLFANAAFPDLEEDTRPPEALVIGPGCKHPYAAKSLFNISAMSYGSISKPAVLALSRGAKLAGCWLNTGEGGLSPYHLEGGCDIVFQIGTAKYGVRGDDGELDQRALAEVAAHDQVKMIEIKLSQGAKPGKGGILPGAKVTDEIARIRGIPVGQASISPNRHPDIGNVAELLDMIARIRRITGKPTGFKMVVGEPAWLDELFREINKRGADGAPDFITVDSADGGTGAAPMPLMDYVGLTIQESLPLVADKLMEYGLREHVRVIASGKLITPGAVAWALAAGADFANNARGFMFALGCIQALRCNKNTCPTGITTHNRRLQRGLDPADKAVRVAHYVENIVKEVGMIAHSCGVAQPRRLGRSHCRVVTATGRTVPLSEIFPEKTPPRHATKRRQHKEAGRDAAAGPRSRDLR